ncbi:MAG: DUF2975 domain-containing protein [Prevotellaceae bacterium]|jgi:hypothetical protein|nr:DUF2975 domain-containing protein [Prevotellaceae bacterium]
MNKRLKILVVLFGVLYVAIVVFNFTSNFDDISGNFMDGYNSVGSEEGVFAMKYSILHFDVLPKGERYCDNMQNLKSGEILKVRTNTYAAKIDFAQMPAETFLIEMLLSIFAWAALFILILIPVLIFKIIRSIVKDDVFNVLNIRRLKWTGYALVFLFVFHLLNYLQVYITAKKLLELQNYEIVFTMGESYLYLIMGIGTLLFAEILKISTKIKEENELTV